MKIKNSILISFVYILGVTLISYSLLGIHLFDLNNIQLDHSGDGFKNYFSFAYHYRYGNGLWFNGMQYPYGDLLSYADGQPAIVLFFQFLRWLGLDIEGNELFVVQFLPIIGMLLACLFLHKIVRSFNIPNYWTIITVISCICLSPQIFRFNSHYALAYLFCIPSIWYFLLRYNKGELNKYWMVLTLSLLLFVYGFIHPYHLLIGAVFILSFAFVHMIAKRKFNSELIIAAILPLALFMISNAILDPYSDRPQNPFGIWEYKTEFSDLLPFYGWFPKIFSFLPGLRNYYHEGYAYIGILGFVSPFVFLFHYSKQRANFKINHLNIFMFAALLNLFFAMGLHLALTDQKLLDIIPSLRQFRALGRFAWSFYYIAFITASVYSYRWISNFKDKRIAYSILSAIVLFWMVDGYSYTKTFNKNIQPYISNNLLVEDQDIQNILKKSNYNQEDFQAVLPLPIPTEGAEKYGPADNWFVKMKCIPYVFQSQTPMVGAYMSRTSLSRILKQSQLGSSSYVKKEILSEINDERPFLMLIAKSDSLMYSDLIDNSIYLGSTTEILAYSLSLQYLAKTSLIPVTDSLVFSQPKFYDNFINESNPGLFSAGALRISGKQELCRMFLDSAFTNKMTFSLWYKIEPDNSTIPFFEIKFYDSNNNLIKNYNYRDHDIHRFEVIEDWVQIKTTIVLPRDVKGLSWNISANNLLIDHAIITEDTVRFNVALDDGYMISNHFLGQTDSSN